MLPCPSTFVFGTPLVSVAVAVLAPGCTHNRRDRRTGAQGVRHFVSFDGCVTHRPSIARLLRGDDVGPVKTGPDVRQHWWAVLGLNQ